MGYVKDIRFAVRLLSKTWLFTLAAIIPIALGVGVNTAMFSVANSLIRKPLSFPDLDRIVMLFQVAADRKEDTAPITGADYFDLKRATNSLEYLAAFQAQTQTLTTNDVPKHVVAAEVSPGFFQVLRTSPVKGHSLGGDTGADTLQGIAVSYHFWQTELGADANVIGRQVQLENKVYVVAGVMPRSFGFPLGVDLWMPLQADEMHADDRVLHRFGVIGKLRPGISAAQLNAELAVLAKSFETAHPETNRGWGFRALPLAEMITGGLTSQYIFFLIGGVVFVLAMACSNVANLLLARGTGRQKELAIRQALGASRWHMVRLLLTESALVAIAGAVLSLPLALVALNLIRTQMPPEIVRYIAGFDTIGLDYTALAFALGTALLSGLTAGVIPALQITRLSMNDILKEGGRSSDSGGSNRRLRQLLLSLQISLAMTLLVGTTLMVKSVRTLSNIIPGGEPEKLLTFRLDLPLSRYPDLPSCRRYFDRVADALQGLPQVESIAIASNIPYGGQGSTMPFTPEGAPAPLPSERRTARTESISPSYLPTLHIGLRTGRNFSTSDGPDTLPVAIVSAALSRRYWPNSDPMSHRLKLDNAPDAKWLTVVGVADDVRYNWLDQATTPAIYLPYAQMPRRASFVLMRAPNPSSITLAAESRVRQLDPSEPIEAVKTWDRVIAESMIGLSYVAYIMTVLGVVALILASFGLYGLMSYDVKVRRTEISIRMALGAPRAAILQFVIGRAALLSLTGIAIGIPCALAISYLMRQLIVGVEPLNWSAYALPALMLLAIGILSAYIPARSALRTSPTEVLRS